MSPATHGAGDGWWMPPREQGAICMLPFISHHLICPVHEWVLQRPTFRCLRELERWQWASPDDLTALQRVKLGALLRHAGAHTPFFRARLQDAGVDVHTDDPFTVLRRLPLLDKAEIRASMDDMLWREAPGGLFEHNTGGSTGEPLMFRFDRRRRFHRRLRLHLRALVGGRVGGPFRRRCRGWAFWSIAWYPRWTWGCDASSWASAAACRLELSSTV